MRKLKYFLAVCFSVGLNFQSNAFIYSTRIKLAELNEKATRVHEILSEIDKLTYKGSAEHFVDNDLKAITEVVELGFVSEQDCKRSLSNMSARILLANNSLCVGWKPLVTANDDMISLLEKACQYSYKFANKYLTLKKRGLCWAMGSDIDIVWRDLTDGLVRDIVLCGEKAIRRKGRDEEGAYNQEYDSQISSASIKNQRKIKLMREELAENAKLHKTKKWLLLWERYEPELSRLCMPGVIRINFLENLQEIPFVNDIFSKVLSNQVCGQQKKNSIYALMLVGTKDKKYLLPMVVYRSVFDFLPLLSLSVIGDIAVM